MMRMESGGAWKVPGGLRWVAGAIVLAWLFAAHAPRLMAVEDDPAVRKFVGKNWVNGRSWGKLEYAGKLGFVCGLFDGVTLFWSRADRQTRGGTDALDKVYDSLSTPSESTVGDVVAAMDEFYRDERNVQLPAVCAYLHFVYWAGGEKPQTIEKRLAAWRRMFKE